MHIRVLFLTFLLTALVEGCGPSPTTVEGPVSGPLASTPVPEVKTEADDAGTGRVSGGLRPPAPSSVAPIGIPTRPPEAVVAIVERPDGAPVVGEPAARVQERPQLLMGLRERSGRRHDRK